MKVEKRFLGENDSNSSNSVISQPQSVIEVSRLPDQSEADFPIQK